MDIFMKKLERCYFDEKIENADEFGEQYNEYVVFKQMFSNGLEKIRYYKKSTLADISYSLKISGCSDEQIDDAMLDFIFNSGRNITEAEIKEKNPDFEWIDGVYMEHKNQPKSSWGYMVGQHNGNSVIFVKDDSYPEFNIRVFNTTINELFSGENVFEYIKENFEKNEKILETDIKDYQEWSIIY